jgi:hypothetical protein
VPIDLNNDGHPDLVIGVGSADFGQKSPKGAIDFLISDGKGKLVDGNSIVDGGFTGEVPNTAWLPRAVDLNNDGYMDIVAVPMGIQTTQTATPLVFMNEGNGHFQLIKSGILPDNISYTVMAVQDLDGDGLADAIYYIADPNNDGFDHFEIYWQNPPSAAHSLR